MAQLKAQIDKFLTNISNGFEGTEGHIVDMLFPKVPVKQKTGKIGKYGAAHLRIEHSLVGGRSEYRRVEPIVRSSDTYSVESHGLEGLVTEDDYRNVEEPFDAEKDETLGLKSLIEINKELAVATSLTDTAVVTSNTTLAGNAQFSDYNNSDPIGVFKTARLAVRDGIGLPPNWAAMDWAVANTLAYAPAILDALGFAQNRAGQLSETELAKALGVEKLYIAKGRYNSAAEGQSDVMANIWGKHILFGYSPASPGKYQLASGYQVVLSGQEQTRVFKYDVKNPPNSTGILVDNSYDIVLTDVGGLYLIKDAIA